MKAKPTNHPGEVLLELTRSDERLMAAAASTVTPFKLKRILVPIDFSDCSKKALQYAVPFAKQHAAAITLLYVVPTNYAAGDLGAIDYDAIEREMSASGEKELSKLAANELQGEVSADIVVRSGSPALQIIDLAGKLPADLIVISTHGRTGLKHVFLGSIAEDVVRRAPCPVLVVREHEHDFAAA
jgi:universal stress protein A